MSPENLKTPEELSDSDDSNMTLEETELTLGLPGAETRGKSGTEQTFPETNRRGSGSEGKAADSVVSGRRNSGIPRALVAAKAQLVAGWPPVRSVWKNAMAKKYVKVAADGAPYLRKVDLEIYDSYDEFLAALQSMFPNFSIRNDNYLGGGRLMNEADGVEYVATYQDKDGDWMLVGDVPWNMFVESCKRLRVMKSSDAMTPRVPDVTSTISSS